MPFTPPKLKKCPVCDKTVYEAEAISFANALYHKLCFKCSVCKTNLDIRSAHHLNLVLYCRGHYNQAAGHTGVRSGTTAVLSVQEGAPSSESDTAEKSKGRFIDVSTDGDNDIDSSSDWAQDSRSVVSSSPPGEATVLHSDNGAESLPPAVEVLCAGCNPDYVSIPGVEPYYCPNCSGNY